MKKQAAKPMYDDQGARQNPAASRSAVKVILRCVEQKLDFMDFFLAFSEDIEQKLDFMEKSLRFLRAFVQKNDFMEFCA